jgi:hypothetical protein
VRRTDRDRCENVRQWPEAFDCGHCREGGDRIRHFVETGEWRPWPKKKKSKGGKAKEAKYRGLMPLMAELRDIDNQTFEQIARDHNVGVSTVRRAYDATHPEQVDAALAAGRPIQRGSYLDIGGKNRQLIREMLLKKAKTGEIRKKIGCSVSTVALVRKQMRDDHSLPD